MNYDKVGKESATYTDGVVDFVYFLENSETKGKLCIMTFRAHIVRESLHAYLESNSGLVDALESVLDPLLFVFMIQEFPKVRLVVESLEFH